MLIFSEMSPFYRFLAKFSENHQIYAFWGEMLKKSPSSAPWPRTAMKPMEF
jgi:hypothetical protein